jgi:acid phosphatase type 7
MKQSRTSLVGLIGVALIVLFAGCTTPHHVYLTWQGDPSTTMTVNFHSPEQHDDIQLLFDTVSREGDLSTYSQRATGTSHQIPGMPDERYIYDFEATELDPGTLYYFIVATEDRALTKERRFRPLPPKDAPLRFISGGDMSILPRAHQLTKLAGNTNPMFGLIGGDIAYANGEFKNTWMWDKWLNMWGRNMVTDDGVMVPMVLAMGNHEANDSEGGPTEIAPFYFGYFAQGGSPYFTRQLRDDTVLVVLDSGHSVPHGGEQSAWLDSTLAAHADTRNTIAVYHAPLYPSHRDFDDGRAEAGRENWLSIFDTHGLRVALENHDHTFKRTKVLKGNEVSETGTVYLGDGSFGVVPRDVPEPDRWYLEKAEGKSHFWLIEIDGDGMHYTAINQSGNILDEVTFE